VAASAPLLRGGAAARIQNSMNNFSIACKGNELMDAIAKIGAIQKADEAGMAFGGFDADGDPVFVGTEKEWGQMDGGPMARNYPNFFISEREQFTSEDEEELLTRH